MRPAAAAALLGTAAVAYGELQRLGRTYGATADERRRRLPGDDLCPEPQATTTHAISIDAPPEHVWPWLVQVGWGRGQWYTDRWVDALLFPRNGPSAGRLVPEWQDLQVGDRVLDGPPDKNCAFVVRSLQPNRHLVLHSCEHLPPGWAERYGATMRWSWAFVLDRRSPEGTRLVVRSRFRLEPRWVEAVYVGLVIPADFVMSRQMLRGIKARAESTTPEDLEAIGRSVPSRQGRRANGHGRFPSRGGGAGTAERVDLRTRLEHTVDKHSVGVGAWLLRRTRGRIVRLWRRRALVLTVRGRRSGRPRTVVVQYFPDGDDLVVVAANSGLPSQPAWYLNLMAAGEARVEVEGRTLRVRAEQLSPGEAEAFWPRVLRQAPDYERYRRRTERVIPLLRLVAAHGAGP
jgi:deazaflavin-dependent oxidoreductase (nitroreductase family)